MTYGECCYCKAPAQFFFFARHELHCPVVRHDPSTPKCIPADCACVPCTRVREIIEECNAMMRGDVKHHGDCGLAYHNFDAALPHACSCGASARAKEPT